MPTDSQILFSEYGMPMQMLDIGKMHGQVDSQLANVQDNNNDDEENDIINVVNSDRSTGR